MARQYLYIIFVLFGFLSMVAFGCGSQSDSGDAEKGPDTIADSTSGPAAEKDPGYPDPNVAEGSFTPADTDPVTGAKWENLVGVIQTNKGKIKVKFFHDAAPRHVENFVYLSRKGFYDGLLFHRYIAGFVIQGGDPEGSGQGGPGYTIPAEITEEYGHVKAAVASARLPDDVNPEQRSSGSQWYICLDNAPHLDGGYTVWGKVIEGMDVALELRMGDVMESVTIREKK